MRDDEISIIINGVRYDAVNVQDGAFCSESCELDCKSIHEYFPNFCVGLIGITRVFKESTKSFEQ